MSIARDIFCFDVPLTMLFISVLSVATDVGGCWCPISAKFVCMEVAYWKFSNKPPNYSSMAYAITFLMMLHSTCTGTFPGGISCIGVFDFGPRKNILRFCFVPLVLICRMHPSKYGESFRFFYIPIFRLDALRCNLEIE